MKQFTDQPIGCRTKVEQMWGKRRDMTVRDRSPFNAEPPASVLADAEITALDAFYSRNHGPFPDIARDQWRLEVDGLIDTPLTLTYDQLITGFTPVSVVATLACAGNRRAELLNVRPIPGKDPWAHGAISTAEWRGARLADVLQAAGVHDDDGLHVAFSAPDVAQEALPVQAYGSSIPLSKAMSREVLLAWEMNSEPRCRATAFRCRRYLSTATSSFLATTSRSLPAR
jgi:sulfite oxidase